MDIQQLKYFKLVAQHGKISSAAETLFLSATALSTSISRLEKELGFQLFDRTNNRIILNQQGEIFLRYVNQILSALDCANAELHQSMRDQKMHVSVYCSDTALWSGLIVAFTQEYPEINLSFSTISQTQLAKIGNPSTEGFLLAVESAMPAALATEYDSIYLFDNAPIVMMHKDHPLAKCTSVDVTMLKNENLLLSSPDGLLYQRIQQLYQMNDIPFPIDNSYPYLARRQMVSNNLGISFSTKYNTSIDALNICTVPLDDPIGPFQTRMYWHKSHPLSQSEQIFRDFAKTFFSA